MTTTDTTKPKRTRKPAGPMTATKAISVIAKIRDKAKNDEAKVIAALPEADRDRVLAFVEG